MKPKKTISEVKENLNKLESEESFTNPELEADDLESRFEKFSKDTAEFTPEIPTQTNEGTSIKPVKEGDGKAIEDNSVNREIKIKMFLGFFSYVLAGVNTLVLNWIHSSKVPLDAMLLSEKEKESFLPYLDDPRIIEFIDKIPGWVMAVAQFEFMMVQKFNLLKGQYKLPKKVKGKEKEGDNE